MVQKPARLTSRLDVRLYPKQRQKLDRFCELNEVSLGRLIRNLVESLKVGDNNEQKCCEQTLPKGLLGKKTAFETSEISRGDVL
jgi:hypothetical protein